MSLARGMASHEDGGVNKHHPHRRPRMVSIAPALGRIKEELGRVLSREHITQVSRDAGLRWRQRALDPVTTVYVFILQVLHANTAMTNLPRLSGTRFTPSAYCQARQRL